MLSTLRNAWKVPDLRKKFYWTIGLIAIFRIGMHIPVSGVDSSFLKQMTQSGLFGFYDLISGGAFSSFSILALGVMPYINASIIMQLLTIGIPSLEQLQKEGEEGKKKIQKATRYLSIVIAVFLAFGIMASLSQKGGTAGLNTFQYIVVLISLVVGSTFCIWLGDQITVKGFGNGTSILIFVNIISRLPMTAGRIYQLKQAETVNIVQLALFAVGVVILLGLSIFFSLAERRVPVQYAGKAVGNKVMKGQSTNIPLSIISAAVIAIIFAMSVMGFPEAIANFFPQKDWAIWIVSSPYSIFNKSTWMYPVVYALLTIFFTWFYNEATLKPEEIAENLNKSAGFVPGIRPGEQTTNFFERVILKISMIGGVYAAILAVIPVLVDQFTEFKNMSFGATALLIVIGVALDFSRRLESQMVMRHYEGFLK
ncbi:MULTISPECIES: preprotein translocase subunit SecY [Clostridium]|uniref:Protein translocase subunit SecY n=1 Tax=Clostridium cibarium TaxID=2762247 RepID=A0ABR8PX65_9CLOT|nr:MULTISPECIES: preprotein translocase subunit SecY [Clostridium]MBD7912729.1 preprotein translocase subunit SecY [Clostridium cibarium]